MAKQYETEAVIQQMTKETEAKCRLNPIAGGSAVEIDGSKYLVGRDASSAPKSGPVDAMLWPLNASGFTETQFELDVDLEAWALAAYAARRKACLVVELDLPDKSRIKKITLP